MKQFYGWSAPVVANILSSVGNFVLTIALAKSLSADQFGWFALAFLVAALAVGAIRSAVLETALREVRELTGLLASAGNAARLSLVVGLVVLVIGILAGRAELAVAGLALPGLVVFDFFRNVMLVAGRPLGGLLLEAVWTGASVLAVVLCLTGWLSPAETFVVWAVVPTIVSAAAWLRLRGDGRAEAPPISWMFGLDYLVGSGSSQVATSSLAFLGYPTVLGALRAGSTLMSPVNLVSSALRPLLIARLAHESDRLRVAVGTAGALALATAPLAAVAVLLPERWGEALLGDSWALAHGVLVPLALEAVLGILTGVAFAGQRALATPARVLGTRIVLSIARVLGIVAGVSVWGLAGAAWALPAVSAVGVIVWWHGFVRVVEEERVNELHVAQR